MLSDDKFQISIFRSLIDGESGLNIICVGLAITNNQAHIDITNIVNKWGVK